MSFLSQKMLVEGGRGEGRVRREQRLSIEVPCLLSRGLFQMLSSRQGNNHSLQRMGILSKTAQAGMHATSAAKQQLFAVLQVTSQCSGAVLSNPFQNMRDMIQRTQRVGRQIPSWAGMHAGRQARQQQLGLAFLSCFGKQQHRGRGLQVI